MSALLKLAVSRDVGTSRPASAAAPAACPANRTADGQQHQPVQLHPLLQSLNLTTVPHFTSTSYSQQPPTAAASQQRNNTTANKQPNQHQYGRPCSPQTSVTCAQAATAAQLAQALQQNPAMLLGSSSAQELLASIAHMQQQQQVQQQLAWKANQQQQLHSQPLAAPVAGQSTGTVIGVHGSSSSSSCGSSLRVKQQQEQLRSTGWLPNERPTAAAAAATAAAAAAAVPSKARPVTPHITKPHKPGSIRMPTAAAAGAANVASAIDPAGATQIKTSKGLRAAAVAANTRVLSSGSRPRTACADYMCETAAAAAAAAACQSWPRTATATIPRPGSAAAAKLLRSLAGAGKVGSNLGAGARGCESSNIQQQQLDGALQVVSQAAGQEDVGSSLPPNNSSSSSSSVRAVDPHSKCASNQVGCAQQLMLLQQQLPAEQTQQQSDGQGWGESCCTAGCCSSSSCSSNAGNCSCSRPSTAFMRALLASRQGRDDISERLEYYKRINSANDHSEGLDIVHETAEEEEERQALGMIPDWLKADNACQAGPMVLNLDDPILSTPEVLEQELNALDFDQLQQLAKTLTDSQPALLGRESRLSR